MTGLYYTYILLLSDGRYYTGITSNMSRRLQEHRSGQSQSTRYWLPVLLIWHYIHFTRQDARRLEVKIKKQGARRFLNRIKYHPNGNH